MERMMSTANGRISRLDDVPVKKMRQSIDPPGELFPTGDGRRFASRARRFTTRDPTAFALKRRPSFEAEMPRVGSEPPEQRPRYMKLLLSASEHGGLTRRRFVVRTKSDPGETSSLVAPVVKKETAAKSQAQASVAGKDETQSPVPPKLTTPHSQPVENPSADSLQQSEEVKQLDRRKESQSVSLAKSCVENDEEAASRNNSLKAGPKVDNNAESVSDAAQQISTTKTVEPNNIGSSNTEKNTRMEQLAPSKSNDDESGNVKETARPEKNASADIQKMKPTNPSVIQSTQLDDESSQQSTEKVPESELKREEDVSYFENHESKENMVPVDGVPCEKDSKESGLSMKHAETQNNTTNNLNHGSGAKIELNVDQNISSLPKKTKSQSEIANVLELCTNQNLAVNEQQTEDVEQAEEEIEEEVEEKIEEEVEEKIEEEVEGETEGEVEEEIEEEIVEETEEEFEEETLDETEEEIEEEAVEDQAKEWDQNKSLMNLYVDDKASDETPTHRTLDQNYKHFEPLFNPENVIDSSHPVPDRGNASAEPKTENGANFEATNVAAESHEKEELRNIPLEPRPLKSRPFQMRKESDPLSPVTCHKPRENRPSFSRRNSASCVIEPEPLDLEAPLSPVKAKPTPPPPPPPPKISTKIRQSVKALEFSFMLTVDDMMKLLNDVHDLVVDNRTKQMEFGSDRGITAFVKVLKKYEDNPDVLELCLLVIADLAAIEVNRDALALKGCIEVVLIAMLKFHDRALLQERGCYALASLAGTHKYQEWIVASNGIQVIMTTQATFLTNVKIQAACLCALHNLAKGNKDNGFAIASKGGIRSLMEIVKRPEYKLEFDFQMEACAVMATLARTNDSNRGSIAKAGGIEVTLGAMKAWPENPKMMAIGFDTLHTLVIGHSQNLNSIMANKGMELLIETMRTHESNESVQEATLLFAKFMTEIEPLATKFGKFGGIKLVLDTMRNHEDNNIIQEEGCSIMCNMSTQHENKGVICKSGGIGMIVMAMKQLSDNFFVQKNGCNALLSLATNDETKKMIASGGGISAMLTAMRNHRDVPALQGLAIGTLRKLATVGRNRSLMKMNNGIETVERAMRNNPNMTYLQNNGEALLLLLDPSRKKDKDKKAE